MNSYLYLFLIRFDFKNYGALASIKNQKVHLPINFNLGMRASLIIKPRCNCPMTTLIVGYLQHKRDGPSIHHKLNLIPEVLEFFIFDIITILKILSCYLYVY